MRSVLWLLVVIGLAATPAAAMADEVVLTNGDRLSGRIIAVTRAAVQIETAAIGVVQIDRRTVDQLSTDEPRAVDLVSGERIVGRIDAASGHAILIRSTILGERQVPLEAIATIHDDRESDHADPPLDVRGTGTGRTGQAQPAAPIGQRPSDTEDIRKVFLRQSTVLLRPGQVEVEMAANYLRTQLVTSVLNASYRQFQLPLAARVGLFDRAEGFTSMPVAYFRQDLGFADSVVSHGKAGAGDATAGINYELARETAGRPDAVVSAGVRMPTGSKPNEQGLSLGTGHWAGTLGVQFIKTVDPVALFAGVHYEHEFPARYFLGDGVHDVEPGETVGYNFGFGFAVNDNVSLSAQVVGSYQAETKADHQPLAASSREPVYLRTALTYRHSPGTYVEPSATIGLDQDTPDFAFGIFLTHRFKQ